MRVLLDTNILHEEGLNSTRMQRILRLVKSNYIELIIPEMVVKEFNSKIVETSNAELQKIQSSIDTLQRKNILTKESSNIKSTVQSITSSINRFETTVNEWLKENSVNVYAISNTSIDVLFSNYFSGNGAFKSKKKREDIPDAVIYDGILKLSEKEDLCVVVKDGTLLKAIKELPNVKSFASLSELLSEPEVKEKTDGLDLGERKVSSIIETLDDSMIQICLAEYIEKNKLVEEESFYEGDFIDLSYELDEIESHTHETHIKEFGYIYIDSPNYLGSSRFSLSISVSCKVDFSFYCTEEQYELLPYPYRKALAKEAQGETEDILVSGLVDAELEGVVVLSFVDENTEPNELKIHLSYLGSDNCDIECDVNLEKITMSEIY